MLCSGTARQSTPATDSSKPAAPALQVRFRQQMLVAAVTLAAMLLAALQQPALLSPQQLALDLLLSVLLPLLVTYTWERASRGSYIKGRLEEAKKRA